MRETPTSFDLDLFLKAPYRQKVQRWRIGVYMRATRMSRFRARAFRVTYHTYVLRADLPRPSHTSPP